MHNYPLEHTRPQQVRTVSPLHTAQASLSLRYPALRIGPSRDDRPTSSGIDTRHAMLMSHACLANSNMCEHCSARAVSRHSSAAC